MKVFGIVFVLLALIGLISAGTAALYLILLILIPLGIFGICELISPTKKFEEEREQVSQMIRAYRLNHNVNEEAEVVKYYSGIKAMDEVIGSSGLSGIKELQDYFFWKDNKNLNIVSVPTTTSNSQELHFYFKLNTTIDINKISYYTIQGDKYVTTDIQGGGSSLGKAVVGGVVAGGAGAVVASRKEVTSTNKVVDDRRTMIYYEDGDEKSIIVLSSSAYEYLLNVLPEKEYNFVMSQQNSNTTSNISELEQLASLRDKGILTEEEFNIKKKQLLGI